MRRFLFLIFLFLSFSLVSYAEPPIEVISWQSSDVKLPSQEEIDYLGEIMVEVQSFIASEMDRYGFGPKTFDFNKNIRGVKGKLRVQEYTSTIIRNESSFIEKAWNNQIYVVFLNGTSRIRATVANGTTINAVGLSQKLCQRVPEQEKYCNNLIVIPVEQPDFILPILAHEIVHAFGITEHAANRFIGNKVDIMYYPLIGIPGVKEELKKYVLHQDHAKILDEGGRLSVQEEPQGSEQVVDADVNDDGYIDLYDVMIVRSGMQNSTSYDTDINNDGVTDENDLAIVKLKAVEAIIAAAPRKRKVNLTTWGALKVQ